MKNRYLPILFAVGLLFQFNYGISQTISWQKTFGGEHGDYLNAVAQTKDGGLILGGRSSSDISGNKTEKTNGKQDIWVVKNDKSGTIQWQKSIGGTGGDFLNSIAQTTDGGYVLGGYSNSEASGSKTAISLGCMDFWVIKLDPKGNVEWQKSYGGTGADAVSKVIQTNDGGYLVGGNSRSYKTISGNKRAFGGWDYYIIKLNATGTILWEKTIGGAEDDRLSDILQTEDGGYVLAGYSNSDISENKTENTNGNFDYWIVKLNNSGSIIWQKTIGGTGDDRLVSIKQTQDGGYVLAGNSTSSMSGDKNDASFGKNDFWILKTNNIGNIVWQTTLGAYSNDVLADVCQTLDGGYMLGGFSDSESGPLKTQDSKGKNDYWIIKIKPDGTVAWEKTIGGEDDDRLTSIIQTNDDGIICAGYSKSNISGDKDQDSFGIWDYWLVKLDGVLDLPEYQFEENIVLYPNPADTDLVIANYSNSSLIRVEIFDINRKLISKIDLRSMAVEKTIDVSTFPAGVYIVEIIGERNNIQKKFIKE